MIDFKKGPYADSAPDEPDKLELALFKYVFASIVYTDEESVEHRDAIQSEMEETEATIGNWLFKMQESELGIEEWATSPPRCDDPPLSGNPPKNFCEAVYFHLVHYVRFREQTENIIEPDDTIYGDIDKIITVKDLAGSLRGMMGEFGQLYMWKDPRSASVRSMSLIVAPKDFFDGKEGRDGEMETKAVMYLMKREEQDEVWWLFWYGMFESEESEEGNLIKEELEEGGLEEEESEEEKSEEEILEEKKREAARAQVVLDDLYHHFSFVLSNWEIYYRGKVAKAIKHCGGREKLIKIVTNSAYKPNGKGAHE
ncbi:hypothetical protein BS50DRAFT_636805 [Corynespora cassiicola Philippines]|uniref:Uncharacterized protein n=1 Tax=Corynespora cassiicola Philippines TaxID=1448308 RepID=A0A2T2NGU7_CORCC|nr:hypothetical protein BS50DRAFT_636805 [Corynespora cassiicola Philippines]